jgi:general stress protein CsbA
MNWLPESGQSKWWGIAGVSAALLGAALLAVRFGVVGQEWNLMNALMLLLLAVVVSAVVAVAGWFGAKWIWLLSTVGFLGGIVYMALKSQDMTGWGDLIGFIMFMFMSAAGFALGIVIEIIVWAAKRFGKTNTQ